MSGIVFRYDRNDVFSWLLLEYVMTTRVLSSRFPRRRRLFFGTGAMARW